MTYKIFESKKGNQELEAYSLIKDIVDNNLSLEEKMENLINSYSEIKLTPYGEIDLIKELISKLGGEIYIPRKGDNSERFDAILTFDNSSKIVAEIEIPSTAILDAPRNLLDDIAVLKSRRDFNNYDIIPLVICWDLPNKRTDYWNVIYDINNILKIKIKTISILALAVYYWTNISFNINDDFYLSSSDTKMNNVINILNENDIDISKFKGYFSPYK